MQRLRAQRYTTACPRRALGQAQSSCALAHLLVMQAWGGAGHARQTKAAKRDRGQLRQEPKGPGRCSPLPASFCRSSSSSSSSSPCRQAREGGRLERRLQHADRDLRMSACCISVIVVEGQTHTAYKVEWVIPALNKQLHFGIICREGMHSHHSVIVCKKCLVPHYAAQPL